MAEVLTDELWELTYHQRGSISYVDGKSRRARTGWPRTLAEMWEYLATQYPGAVEHLTPLERRIMAARLQHDPENFELTSHSGNVYRVRRVNDA